YPQAKQLHEEGVEVHTIAGFRNKDIVILEDEMRAVSDELIVATDDGSYGKHGFVTDMLRELIEAGNEYDVVIAIGPIPMMKAVCALTKPYGIKTMVSLNPIMVDGTGMCGCCRVTVDGKIRFACVDGPDFDGHLVDFEELMHRNRFYKKQEEHDRDHACQLFGGSENA
ncbi:MAG: sulfide/dihydroorotate dehydrogenase-like FAD/NAD-binding protein, partial [Oscillospiraceae bacterium]|nr:sulfide/dihydroorotate dehydrogenase-like FAD/NAD-binding protein [Oscillospiraceae bacterium]